MIEKAGYKTAGAMPEMPMREKASEAGERQTTTIDSSILGDQVVEPGDVVRLKVVSVDEENGTVELAYEHPARREDEMGEMAGKFDNEPMGES